MLVIFLRALILYCLVFAVIRLMGKRQISELQPFDLVFALLIADLASNPIGDTSVPLFYGIIPILALFLMQQFIAYLSLKSERARGLFAGRPQIVIAHGVLLEDVMRSARYNINDLMEQLRGKDVFDISRVSYAIIETNGSLSVMLKATEQPPSTGDLNIKPTHTQAPSGLVVLDGKLHKESLAALGYSEAWLIAKLKGMGFTDLHGLFVVSLSPKGELFVQAKQSCGAAAHAQNTPGGLI